MNNGVKYLVKQGDKDLGHFSNKKLAITLAKSIHPGRKELAARIEVYCGNVMVCTLNSKGEVCVKEVR